MKSLLKTFFRSPLALLTFGVLLSVLLSLGWTYRHEEHMKLKHIKRAATAVFTSHALLVTIGLAQAQTLTLTPSTIPAGHTGRIVNVVLTPGGTDTTLTGQTFTATNSTAFPNNTTVTITGQSITDATHAVLTITTGAGGGAVSVKDTNNTAVTLTQRIPAIMTSPTFVPVSSTATITVTSLNTLWATDNPQFTGSALAGTSVGAATATADTASTFTLTTGATAGNLTLTDPSTGATTLIVVGSPSQRVYIPAFNSLAGLTAPTGLSIATNGGLVAATAGTNGTASIPFASYIDQSKPWRIGALFEWNGDTANTLRIEFLATGPNSNQGMLGFNVGNGGAFASTEPAGSSTLPLISGQRYWFWAGSSGDGRVMYGVEPYYLAGRNGNVFNGTAQLDYINQQAAPTYAMQPGNSYEVVPYFGIGSVTLKSNSATTRLLGLLVQQTGLAGGTDPQCQPPVDIPATVNGDNTAILRISPKYDGVTPTPLFIVSHPNGSDENSGTRSVDPDGGAALALISRAGYNEAWMRSTTNYTGTSYSAPPASGWGSDAQEVFWKSLVDYNKALLPLTGKVYWFGQSMGGVTGLRFHMKYPGVLSGLFGNSIVTNLSYAYSTETFSSIIDQAYSNSGNFITGGNAATFDPNLNPAAFSNLPMLLFYGAADTLVHPASHTLLFATNVNAGGGKVKTVAVPGAGHLDNAAEWDGTAMLNFLNTLNTSGTKRRLQ